MAKLIILGSGTGVPSSRRGAPSTFVISESSNVLIDSGSGTLRKMLEIGMTYQDIDLLLYTHIHPDHVIDFVSILFACNYGDLPRQKDFLCLGGPGFKHYHNQIKKIYGPWIEPRSYNLTVKETSTKPIFFRDLKILCKPMSHIPESIAYRIEFRDGKSLVISGDTDYCRNIIDLAFKTDLLILECSFPDGKKVEGHLTPSLAGRIALESSCKKLLLTHLYPVCDQFDIVGQCKKIFKGQTILGGDLMRIKI